MKRIIASLLLLACFGWAGAQTLNVVTGDVTYAFTCDQTDDMEFTGTQSVTICNREFLLEDINQMAVVDEEIDDNTVNVSYSGTTAKIVVAGNIAQYINAEVSGAHVKIIADELLPDHAVHAEEGVEQEEQRDVHARPAHHRQEERVAALAHGLEEVDVNEA